MEMERNTFLIKIGGSIATDKGKPRTANTGLLKSLLSEIHTATRETGARLVLGHGGGSYPHATAVKYGLKASGSITDANRLGFLMTQLDARELNTIIANIAVELDMPVFPISPSSFCVVENGAIKVGTATPITAALENGYIPLVYGDCIQGLGGRYGICSTESIFEFLCGYIRPNTVISIGDIAGVYDEDPHKRHDAKLIRTVSRSNIDKVLAYAGGSMHADVTGGMADKLVQLWKISAKIGKECHIVDGTVPGNVYNLVTGAQDVPHTTIDAMV
ncbi:MAG: hypothetical protein KGH60_01505 [Candidatus Micrarchaeota archaeon]|nr:hypothetical protein [Candidatus Micrarchaeota archaeon]